MFPPFPVGVEGGTVAGSLAAQPEESYEGSFQAVLPPLLPGNVDRAAAEVIGAVWEDRGKIAETTWSALNHL